MVALERILSSSDNIVFFGGAGVSTESGIPDFRSTDGLYNLKYKYPPEHILSHSFFMTQTKSFYDFYRDKMLYLNARPNNAHIALARLEQMGKLRAVVTQNIDGLHQQAGSNTVVELHGSVHRNACMQCGRPYGIEIIINSANIPICECGGIIKPDVVLYEEGLNADDLRNATQAISEAEVLIVGGTSLNVYPASGLLNYFAGKNLVLINKSATAYDQKADLVIRESIGTVLKSCVDTITS